MKITRLLLSLGLLIASGLAVVSLSLTGQANELSQVISTFIQAQPLDFAVTFLLLTVVILAFGVHSERYQLTRLIEKFKRSIGQLQDNDLYATG